MLANVFILLLIFLIMIIIGRSVGHAHHVYIGTDVLGRLGTSIAQPPPDAPGARWPLFCIPHMALVQATTQFGRLEHRCGPLALFVGMTLHDNSIQRVLLRSLAIQYAGTWYQPIYFFGDRVHLWYNQGQLDTLLPCSQSLIAVPHIPADTSTERFALFPLPPSWNRWPTYLRVTAKGTFVHRRTRSLVVTLTNSA